ncbi:MAG: hypothetical protein HYV26_04840 [Candidatus Hydrogenedentes bacterium]|nr:hypothetical protein [Candidatus Hydrogenedentota bacterium]
MIGLAPLAPEALQALVERDREVVWSIVCTLRTCKSMGELEADRSELQRLIRQLTPETQPYGETLLDKTARWTALPITQEQVTTALVQVSIYHWLHAATVKLCIEARELVLPELLEHYQQAVEAADPALPTNIRCELAVKSLGSAKIVSRQLMRIHLSQEQKDFLVRGDFSNITFVWMMFPLMWNLWPIYSIEVMAAAALPIGLMTILVSIWQSKKFGKASPELRMPSPRSFLLLFFSTFAAIFVGGANLGTLDEEILTDLPGGTAILLASIPGLTNVAVLVWIWITWRRYFRKLERLPELRRYTPAPKTDTMEG